MFTLIYRIANSKKFLITVSLIKLDNPVKASPNTCRIYQIC